MDTITLKISGKKNVSFFISLAEKFNFIKEITVTTDNAEKDINKEAINKQAQKIPLIEDIAGLWHDNPVTIDDIRNKGWKRN